MKTFFVYLDILGFKNLIKRNTEQQLTEIVKSFFDGFNKAVDDSRTISFAENAGTTEDAYKINLKELNFRLLSDSILIWSQKDCFRTFRNMLDATSQIVAYGLQYGFPLRGAMTYGEVVVQEQDKANSEFFTNEAIYGKALLEAYSIENRMDWSGCIVTPNAWKRVCEEWSCVLMNDHDSNAYFWRYPCLVWYPIPFKERQQEGIVVNWNVGVFYDSKKKIDPNLVRNSFCAYGNDHLADTKKVDETLRFLDYTNQLQSCCFGPSVAESQDRREIIPVPSADYRI